MELYSSNKDYKLYHGNMLDMLEVIEPNTIDSIITDPPYGLTSITKRFGKENSAEVKDTKGGFFKRLDKGFMGKEWDGSGIEYNVNAWRKCYEVLKPGGYLLAFGGTRTFHRIACAIEDAGFEIRDTIMWLYGSGFPKSMDISKQLDKRNGKQNEDFTKFGNYVKQCREAKGYSKNDIDKIMGTNTACSWWEGRIYKDDFIVQLPDKENYYKLKEILDMNNDFDYLIEWQEAERKVIGQKEKLESYQYKNNNVYQTNGDKEKIKLDITAPSTDLAKQWQGWGTALKPSYEPIIVARKPFKGSLVDNVIEYGVGGINIDECRVGNEERTYKGCSGTSTTMIGGAFEKGTNKDIEFTATGRFPANTILTYDDNDFDEVCGAMPNTKSNYEEPNANHTFKGNKEAFTYGYKMRIGSGYNDEGSASRYFYCAKASKKDRDEGLDEFEEKKMYDGKNAQFGYGNTENDNFEDRIQNVKRKNTHPTVKPTELMQYLIRLVSPDGATILDPFNGSGSTGKAVMYENKERNKNYKYIGIELIEEYLPISKARIEHLINIPKEIKQEENIPTGQTSIFDFIGESND